MLRTKILVISVFLAGMPTLSFATETPDVCSAAAKTAEQAHRLPDGLLQAIALVESGTSQSGDLQGWPWTVNADGRGYYFDTAEKAKAFADRKLRNEQKAFDVGCFQINVKWHGDAFPSINEMFDPLASAHYAATFLKELKSEFGDWKTAAKSYHSRDAAKGNVYGAKIAAVLDGNIMSSSQALNESFFGGVRSSNLTLAPGAVALNIFFAPSPLVGEPALAPLIQMEH